MQPDTATLSRSPLSLPSGDAETRPAGDSALPTVAVDTRERTPLPFSKLATKPATLREGDYQIAGLENLGLFVIERKSIEDLVGCVGADRERFEAQLLRLRGYSFARLLIVGTEQAVLQHQYHSGINPRSVLASLYAFEARYVPVVWSPTPQTAARLVERYVTWTVRELQKNLNLLEQSISTPAG
jgi:ERCC4-type nuclease